MALRGGDEGAEMETTTHGLRGLGNILMIVLLFRMFKANVKFRS
jgi:hypothetical protein